MRASCREGFSEYWIVFHILQKEFIRNALNDKNPSEKFALPLAVDDYEPLTMFESAATVEDDSQSSSATDVEGKMRTALLQLVAEIFFKLITTFKHTWKRLFILKNFNRWNKTQFFLRMPSGILTVIQNWKWELE